MMNRRLGMTLTGRFCNRAAVAATALAVMALACGARAQTSDPLLNTLIKKGILTEDEARSIKAEAETSQSNNPAAAESKWKISNPIKSLEFFWGHAVPL